MRRATINERKSYKKWLQSALVDAISKSMRIEGRGGIKRERGPESDRERSGEGGE